MFENLVIFDGSNFYHRVKKLLPEIHLSNFNYRKLIELLTHSKENQIEYCVGEIRQNKYSKKSKKMYSSQQKLFYNLEKQQIIIKKGFMLLTNDVYHEKGVDVRIALDIQRGAIKNEYKKCYLVSSDTDIIPAIIDAKQNSKIILYVCFENFISHAMVANCSKTVTITKEMLLKCVPK